MDEELKERVKKVFIRVFAIGEDDFGIDKTHEDFENWDSLSHMNLVAELEQEFGVSMEVDEISEMDSVKNVLEVLKKKLGGNK